MANLDNNLIIDLDDGYRSLEAMKITIHSAQELFEIRDELAKIMKETGKKPYKFITIDNVTRVEEIILPYAAHLYRSSTPMGQNWGMIKDPNKPGQNLIDPKTKKPIPDPKADVRLLPNGAGWGYIRTAFQEVASMYTPFCETLILVGHVKDKQISKEGVQISEMSIDLSGKTGEILCGMADAIGLIYRKAKETIISFEGGEDSIKEARPLHLRGKKFTVITSDDNNELNIDLSKVFI